MQHGIIGMLKELFNKYTCDKGSLKHHYYKEYEQYFEDCRLEELNILEIGTFKGASTDAFRDYFPNSNLYVIDLFDRVRPENVKALHKDRVKWIESDSTSSSLPSKIRSEWGDIKFDFIIDDGAHWPEANQLTFQNTMPFLSQNGTYFIEDVWPLHKMSHDQLRHPYLKQRAQRYDLMKHDRLLSVLDQYKTKHHDRRKETNCGDTYIIAIQNK